MMKMRDLMYFTISMWLTACSPSPPQLLHDLDAATGDAGTGDMTISRIKIGNLDVRVGQVVPSTAIKGDVLFLHGFADRLDNHGPLFDGWVKAGFRVISFDFPDHGETTGADLDKFAGTTGPIKGLAELASEIEKRTHQDGRRPLILAGWSTGGLVAVRMLQGITPQAFEGRTISGTVLFAPGVTVRILVGEGGTVTTQTLTNNPSPPHRGPIKPLRPAMSPVFAADLLINGANSWKAALPAGIPALVVLADDNDDRYVVPQKLREWVTMERSKFGAKISAFQCAHAKHELDNEPEPVGSYVRQAAWDFAVKSVEGSEHPIASAGPCTVF
jgi:pimeloyl-ACP methyl ester carboxylesterase